MSHFESIFLESVSSVPILFFACGCFNINCWKDYPFSTELPILLYQRLGQHQEVIKWDNWVLWAIYTCGIFINALLVISFANISSHSIGCLFILFMVFFDVQKLLCLIRSCMFTFFYFYDYRGWIQKGIAVIYVKECSSYVFLYKFYSI